MPGFGDLRGILNYVPQFRGRVFVIALDGAVVASPNFSNILLDLGVLHSLNIRVVLVHGASAQVGKLAAERAIAPSDTEGIGPTDDATLQVSVDAISRLTSDLMRDLTGLGVRAATTNALIARPAGVVGGTDLGHTGRIERVEVASLNTFLEQEMVPLVPPLGFDGRGNTLRLNSDSCAAALASSLGAAKLVFVSSDALGSEPVHLTVEDAERLAAADPPGGSEGFRSKLKAGAQACRNGVPRAHIIDGSINEALLEEFFGREGVATMIYVDTYQKIRQARVGDVPDILSLIHQSVEDDELVRRTRRELLDQVADYYVLEVDGHIVGTVAAHMLDDDETVELACLFIKKSHEGRGYGGRLIRFAEKKAREFGAVRVVALSTQASGFFERVGGYAVAPIGTLPLSRREKLSASGRNSKVLEKML